MGKPDGFMKYPKKSVPYRDARERVGDFAEIFTHASEENLKVRNVAIQLQRDPRVSWFRVSAVNHESIHNHSAFASLAWTRLASTATSTASTERPILDDRFVKVLRRD
jgi:hypothetical protein